ncbi:hypothetical protein INT45_009965 [Circinella minor]|uniref:Uncharacterized protein n=1 Tax=Circinella minor TaxID=1195481 RepID=A0A8H7RVF1_9FUNG|nr:hypothetical protein INT45_009965 [Circinella minor]
MAVTGPKLNARVSLRYALAMVPLSLSIPYLGLTSWWFALDSSIANAGLIYGAYRFYKKKVRIIHYIAKKKSDEKNARQLFFGSIVHLPVLMALLMVHKVYDMDMSHLLSWDDDFIDEEESQSQQSLAPSPPHQQQSSSS